jgi:hypothetical protein
VAERLRVHSGVNSNGAHMPARMCVLNKMSLLSAILCLACDVFWSHVMSCQGGTSDQPLYRHRSPRIISIIICVCCTIIIDCDLSSQHPIRPRFTSRTSGV